MSDNVVESIESFLERFALSEANSELQAAARRLAANFSSSAKFTFGPTVYDQPRSRWDQDLMDAYEAELQFATAIGLPDDDYDL